MAYRIKKPGVAESEPTAMTQLKELWCRKLSEATKEEVRALLDSTATIPKIRAQIKELLGVNLAHDQQYHRFYKFVEEQDVLDDAAWKLIEDERRLREKHKDISEETLRKKLIKAYYARAWVRDDTKLGKFALQQSLNERRLLSKEEKALAFCLTHARRHPEVHKLFIKAFAALEKTKAL